MSEKTTIENGWKGLVKTETGLEKIDLPVGETIYKEKNQWAFHMNAIDLIIYFKEICTPNGSLLPHNIKH